MMMSQHMEYDEPSHGYTGNVRERTEPSSDDYDGVRGQKLGQGTSTSTNSGGTGTARLILAIWSLIATVGSMGILVALVIALPGIGAVIGLIALAMVCLTIVAINIVFNLRR